MYDPDAVENKEVELQNPRGSVDTKRNEILLCNDGTPIRTTPRIFHERPHNRGIDMRRVSGTGDYRITVNDAAGVSDEKKAAPKEVDDGQSSMTSAYKTRCCGELAFSVNKKFVAFIVQTVVILAVLIFSMHQAVNGEKSRRETFLIIITTILSVYLPSPQIPNANNNETGSKIKKKRIRR
eukprot:jgi/Bigna1/129896/aug1.10_g4604